MRLPVNRIFRRALLIGLVALGSTTLGACAMVGGDVAGLESAPATPYQNATNGPAADYPVVVGDPYRVGSQLFTPVDTMNYDEVGYAVADEGEGVTAENHTLPLPSYVEVTSLEDGHTILVRVERRGPMTSDALIGLSPDAFAQLGVSPGSPVRVRRVNPPEEEREMLRAGQGAPPRMDTPGSLLAVLKRKLPGSGSVQLARQEPPNPIASVPVAASNAGQAVAEETPTQALKMIAQPVVQPLPSVPVTTSDEAKDKVASTTLADAKAEPAEKVSRPATKPAAVTDGKYVVQAAALSSLEKAQHLASAIGGHVSQTGSLYRIRTGPFVTRGQAEASLAKVRAAGYRDARIYTNG